MAKLKNVAVIGLSSLESIAVKELLRRHPGAATESFAGFSDFACVSSQFEAFVCDARTFVLNSSFFMPRRAQSVVVFQGASPDSSFQGHHVKQVAGKETGGNVAESPFSIFSDSDETYVDALLSRVLADDSGSKLPSAELSSREKEVLGLIAQGLSNKEIADRLCISVNTAITHRKNISSKLGIKSASALSLYALMNGLI